MASQSVKFYAVFNPVRNSRGEVTSVRLDRATTNRPSGISQAGGILVQLECEIPVELFELKAKAKLACDTAVAIKSLREIEKDLR